MNVSQKFDVIVVGGGHAGTEAALASARCGAKTLLLSHNIETLGQMSCNPAIGGIGKSHLVKEIDALGGVMAKAADAAGIHIRRLNASKGPAVCATRMQSDRALYKHYIRNALENQPNLTLFQAAVDDLVIDGERVVAVVTDIGLRFDAPAIVLTVGTFLGGKMHIGDVATTGGRMGDPPSIALANTLRALPFRVERLKTGTPPRIDGRSIDYAELTVQAGDEPRPVFSFVGSLADHPQQTVCHITQTNPRTHDIIRDNLERSAMYAGHIQGTGPRYCPSIEDKVVRFADKQSHPIFIEPEGLHTHQVYPNGISTSLPFAVQLEYVRSIKGFENAHITRPGYAIEYDFFDPRDLKQSLETKLLDGLYFAGQINGTTGYEEAGAQGLIAGLNAARAVRDLPAWCPRRDEAYVGVLIDDLITCGTNEPYRMFTSRAEYRLQLREDNADARLTEIGRKMGLVDDHRWRIFSEKYTAIERLQEQMHAIHIRPDTEQAHAIERHCDEKINKEQPAIDLLKRPKVTIAPLLTALDISCEGLDYTVLEQVETRTKYAGYVNRQREEIERQRRQHDTILPASINYERVGGLSAEVRQKLSEQRPETIGQAARIPGITPAAVSLLLVHLKRSA